MSETLKGKVAFIFGESRGMGATTHNTLVQNAVPMADDGGNIVGLPESALFTAHTLVVDGGHAISE